MSTKNVVKQPNGRIQIALGFEAVFGDEQTAKFWLTPVAIARNIGFRARELCQIHRMILERADEFLEAWNEFFGA